MNFDEIVGEWSKDCKIDETELSSESLKIPYLHSKYLKMLLKERSSLIKLNADYKKTKRKLLEYYLGEMDREELDEFGRDQIYKKILKNEVDTYIDSDDMMIEATLKMSFQQEKVDYLESVLKNIANRGFQIKNAIDWERFTGGS